MIYEIFVHRRVNSFLFKKFDVNELVKPLEIKLDNNEETREERSKLESNEQTREQSYEVTKVEINEQARERSYTDRNQVRKQRAN